MEMILCNPPAYFEKIYFLIITTDELRHYINDENTTSIYYFSKDDCRVYLQIEQGTALLPDCMEVKHFWMAECLFQDMLGKTRLNISWEKEGF